MEEEESFELFALDVVNGFMIIGEVDEEEESKKLNSTRKRVSGREEREIQNEDTEFTV